MPAPPKTIEQFTAEDLQDRVAMLDNDDFNRMKQIDPAMIADVIDRVSEDQLKAVFDALVKKQDILKRLVAEGLRSDQRKAAVDANPSAAKKDIAHKHVLEKVSELTELSEMAMSQTIGRL
eukprot:TRINITY_DN21981_c0_g1_i1.p2 TRINITY_DN21981_c0_g1~~TRINITY_DN21981_c0_g1_i1.p2  ORF type:complete len:121 (+),score=52.31 TRINITY_DN21981_c0_g1_i1:81-443(+)